METAWMEWSDEAFADFQDKFLVEHNFNWQAWEFLKDYLDPPVFLFSAPNLPFVCWSVKYLFGLSADCSEMKPLSNCKECGILVQEQSLVDGRCLRCFEKEAECSTALSVERLSRNENKADVPTVE